MTNEELDKKFKKIKSDLEEIKYINSKIQDINETTKIKEEK